MNAHPCVGISFSGAEAANLCKIPPAPPALTYNGKYEGQNSKDRRRMEEELSTEQYQVCRMKATESPFTGKYYNSKQSGMYRCVACGNELFDSAAKFDS